ncbi:MAG: class I SAM-dependent methyltransferase [Acidobacteriota bacterium]
MSRTRARELAKEFLDRGNPKGWFEAFYIEAKGDESAIPWANLTPNPEMVAWLDANAQAGEGRRALVIGCGLGDDAEAVAARGFAVTSFDISPQAIAWCKQRFPNSQVNYVVADLLAPPSEWQGTFDLVVEINTLQVLPEDLRQAAMKSTADFLAENGTLLVIARAREPEEDRGAMPWPLTRAELAEFETLGLAQVHFEEFFDDETPPARRFKVHCRKQTT